jgi:hypothetical protein
VLKSHGMINTTAFIVTNPATGEQLKLDLTARDLVSRYYFVDDSWVYMVCEGPMHIHTRRTHLWAIVSLQIIELDTICL